MPPSSEAVRSFMEYFATRYRVATLSPAQRLLAIPAAHHRFNYIHPFLDGNGRVSRLMSHAMAYHAGIAGHGLWSISRGLARGLKSPTEYKAMMDLADTPRQGDSDGRGDLSQRALIEFSTWFFEVCLDQIRFMNKLFELEGLAQRLLRYAAQAGWRVEAGQFLVGLLHRGEVSRGEVAGMTGLGERTARSYWPRCYARASSDRPAIRAPFRCASPWRRRTCFFRGCFLKKPPSIVSSRSCSGSSSQHGRVHARGLRAAVSRNSNFARGAQRPCRVRCVLFARPDRARRHGGSVSRTATNRG